MGKDLFFALMRGVGVWWLVWSAPHYRPFLECAALSALFGVRRLVGAFDLPNLKLTMVIPIVPVSTTKSEMDNGTFNSRDGYAASFRRGCGDSSSFEFS